MITKHRQQLALLEAVAGRQDGGALLIHEDNTGGGWVPAGQAVSDGRAYAVVPHPGLLVVDLDDEPNSTSAAAFWALVKLMRSCELVHFTCRSGSPGHQHLYCVTGQLDQTTRWQLDSLLRRSGLDVRRNGVRPPLAPHRNNGTHSEPSCGVSKALQRLAVVANPATVGRFLESVGVSERVVSERSRALLVKGHHWAGYPSASEARMGVALQVVAAGGSSGLLAQLFSNPANVLGETFRRRGTSWQAGEVRRLERRAWEYLAEHRYSSSAGEVDAWIQTVQRQQWKGRAGHSELAVLEGFGGVARRCLKTRIAYAAGDVAVDAGLARSTVRAALRRLEAKGWIKKIQEPTAIAATLWQLQIPGGWVAPGREAGGGDVVLDASLGCDAARQGGVGKAGVRVWRLLGNLDNVASIAGRLGVTCQTVRYHLNRLRGCGLAERCGGRWRRGDHTLDQVACWVGTAGRQLQELCWLAEHRLQRRRFRVQTARRGRYATARKETGHPQQGSPGQSVATNSRWCC